MSDVTFQAGSYFGNDLRTETRKDTVCAIVLGGVADGKSTLIRSLVDELPISDNRPHWLFSTRTRTFMLAEASGVSQTTDCMIAAASTADLAIVLVDARKGVLTETRRHSYLTSVFGIGRVVLAINKMDLVGYSKEVFERIHRAYIDFASRIGLERISCIPTCALDGTNIVEPSDATPWYTGPTLLQHLESVSIGVKRAEEAVVRTDAVDESRGRVFAAGESRSGLCDRFEATIMWMSDRPMLQGRSYRVTIGTDTITATLAPLKYKVNLNTLEHVAATTLDVDDIGICGVQLSRPVPFEPCAANRHLRGFTLVDRITHAPVGVGVLHLAVRGSQHGHWQALNVDKTARAAMKAQKPCVVWFTGLSGAGKSTIANLLEQRLHTLGCHTYLLDGDNVRHGLNKDLGFTDVDRVENIRRIAEVARLMVDAGLIVLVSFISPFRAERQMARELMEEKEFFEVFVDTPLAVAESRDPKGLYKKARRGELKNFTGIDSPYEAPERAEVRLKTTCLAPCESAELILKRLQRARVVVCPQTPRGR